MRILLLSMATVAVGGSEPGYVDPAVCRGCHTALYDSYAQTGMARTFGVAGQVPELKQFRHEESKRWYAVEQREGASYLRRQDAEGNGVEKRIDFAIGSGAHSRTYVHRAKDGRLLELPVSWYSEGDRWAMSPGYDRPDHSDFRREVTAGCLFCHNGYPSEANGGLAKGIDCQRCHGPGEGHVRGRGPILNPARLSPQRQVEVCLQCHLEPASRTLPDAVKRVGRTVYSYRPSEPLGDYQVYFDFVRSPENEERITVNNAGYGLLRSACYRRSAGKLTCTACHDPHRPVSGKDYTAVCRNCHEQAHAPAAKDCTGCHMPKRRTEDAVHVVLTDHFIRRQPLRESGTGALRERHDPLRGAVRPLYPLAGAERAEDKLYLAMAQVGRSAGSRGDIAALESAIAAIGPSAPEPYVVLGEAYRKANRPVEALAGYRRAIQMGARDPSVTVAAAELMMQLDRLDEAAGLLENGLRGSPGDGTLSSALAVLYGRRERFDKAIVILEEAIRLNPEAPLTWLNLGVCHQALGQRDRAAADYREAIRLQPDFERARQYLQALLKD